MSGAQKRREEKERRAAQEDGSARPSSSEMVESYGQAPAQGLGVVTEMEQDRQGAVSEEVLGDGGTLPETDRDLKVADMSQALSFSKAVAPSSPGHRSLTLALSSVTLPAADPTAQKVVSTEAVRAHSPSHITAVDVEMDSEQASPRADGISDPPVTTDEHADIARAHPAEILRQWVGVAAVAWEAGVNGRFSSKSAFRFFIQGLQRELDKPLPNPGVLEQARKNEARDWRRET